MVEGAVPIQEIIQQLPSLSPAAGLSLLFGVMVLQVVVPPIPAELIVVSAGKAYGLQVTTAVAGAGLWAGSVAVYGIGYWLRRRFDRFFEGDKVSRVLAQLRRYGLLLLWVRVLPYNPSDVISYAAGILRLEWRRFVAITMVTSFLRCLALGWLGTTIEDVRTVLQVMLLLVASAALTHYLVYRRHAGAGTNDNDNDNDNESRRDE